MKKNYQFNQLSYAEQLKFTKIPKFQRSLVWSKQKKLDLLKTLHKNFPFGSLLVSPISSDKSSYRLLDGQQRLSTIKNFEDDKLFYWKQLNAEKYNKLLEDVNLNLSKNSLEPISSYLFDQLLSDEIELADWTDEYDKDDFQNVSKRELRNQITKIKEEIENYINLSTLTIPVIEFLGDEADLPEVFENLNRGGVPLTKYEVLNASWSEEFISIPENNVLGDEILRYVKEYYNKIRNNSAFELDNFSEDDITSNRSINLAELSRAIGEFVVNRIPSLVSKKDKSNNEIGFGLMGIITGTHNKKIATLKNKSSFIQNNIDNILQRLNSIANQINAPFDKLLRQNISFSNKKNSKKEQYSNGLSTTFKVLSYFASLWDMSENDVKVSLQNIPSYYIYDYLTKAWTAHGDERLFEYYSGQTKNYLSPLNKDSFISAFNSWILEFDGNRKTFSKEIKALITIHSNLTYMSREIPKIEDYEFEHVIPKARILNSNVSNKVILSHLGNGMFLPKSLNNSKSSHTLYEYNQSDYNTLITESNYFTSEEFNSIFNALDNSDDAFVNNIIKSRAKLMAINIADKICQ